MRLIVGSSSYPPQRIFCIGKNYAEHIKEMKGETPKSPIVFMKPPTSLVPDGESITFPKHGKILHHEVEIVILIGKDGRAESQEEAKSFMGGLSIGLDLTLRDIQEELSRKGLPWELSKSFDKSAAVGDFIPFKDDIDLGDIPFSCEVNGTIRQQGNSKDMIFPIKTLIVELSKVWELRTGDLIYTGTPSGVSGLKIGDKVEIKSPLIGRFYWEISE